MTKCGRQTWNIESQQISCPSPFRLSYLWSLLNVVTYSSNLLDRSVNGLYGMPITFFLKQCSNFSAMNILFQIWNFQIKILMLWPMWLWVVFMLLVLLGLESSGGYFAVGKVLFFVLCLGHVSSKFTVMCRRSLCLKLFGWVIVPLIVGFLGLVSKKNWPKSCFFSSKIYIVARLLSSFCKNMI